MKVTITFENNINEDGEDTTVSFSKDDIEFVEDYLNAVGRAGIAGGFTYLTGLKAYNVDDNTTWYAEF